MRMKCSRPVSRVSVGTIPRRPYSSDFCRTSIALWPGQCNCPCPLWRQFAFDSVDHSILLQRLTTSFGLVDQPLAWLKSFLSDRFNCVVLGQSRSPWVPAPFGVPQGSVLGPLLYLLYMADISPLLAQLGLLLLICSSSSSSSSSS